MKIYYRKPGKRLKSDHKKDWEITHKCKRCKTSATIKFSELQIECATFDNDKYEEKTETKPRRLFGTKTVNMERDMFEKIKVYRAVCPNCAKTKKLFFKGESPKTYEYGEWYEVNYFEGY